MFTQKNSKAVFISTVLGATLAFGFGRAWANDDGVIQKQAVEEEEAAGLGNYCHLKFPAIEPGTLGSNHPVLESKDTGEIVDFYGPCNHDPLGADEVKDQIQNEDFWLNRDGE